MDTTSFKVEDLTEGDEYEFRVVAYNEAGASRPSSTAGPIVIQDQTCKIKTLKCFIRDTIELHYEKCSRVKCQAISTSASRLHLKVLANV